MPKQSVDLKGAMIVSYSLKLQLEMVDKVHKKYQFSYQFSSTHIGHIPSI